MIEIEYKYLVDKLLWGLVDPQKQYEIKQAYMHSDPEKTIRVRTKGERGFITIKGKTIGSSRAEYEYEIPYADAVTLIDQFCAQCIEKIRYEVIVNGKRWEVDVFSGKNEGLIVAEIELLNEDEHYSKPNWATENVTSDIRFANSNLAKKPFSSW